jgi:glycosyltransferase involved in cell wall biosynthesis
MVTGSVIDIWPYINSIDIFVFPINMGAGLKNKILETMYARKPVITTDIGNEGINAIPGQDLLICRTPDDFQREVIRLFNIPEEGIKMGNSARRFIEEKFGWDKIFKNYEALINGDIVVQ